MSEEKLKFARVSFSGNKPMNLSLSDNGESKLTDEQRAMVDQLAEVLMAYLKAGRDLLAGKYAHLRQFAPSHLVEKGNILVACCIDGAVIRYEKASDSPKFAAGWMDGDLASNTAALSQKLIRCHPTKDEAVFSSQPENGIEIRAVATNPTTKESTEIFSARVGFNVVISRPPEMPHPPMKPFCLFSIRNRFEFGLRGEFVDDGKKLGEGQPFLTRTPMELPVGWSCIEAFPFLDMNHWKPEYAAAWAENDILGAVVTHQMHEAQFLSLDPQATSRRLYGKLLAQFKTLLDSSPEREEILQRFLKENPVLLCPTQTKMWAKLPLGARVTDFVFRDAVSDYLLVELEKSTDPLFRKDGHVSSELSHAMGQIADWKRYLEDNLSTVQRELRLSDISSNPRSLVVIGRSSLLSPENRRKLKTMDSEHPKLRIMTYDDVYDNAKAVIENLLGPIWEETGATRIYYPKPRL